MVCRHAAVIQEVSFTEGQFKKVPKNGAFFRFDPTNYAYSV